MIGPLPSSEGYKYAITGVDMATGLLAAYPAQNLDQKAAVAALEQLCAAYRLCLILESDQKTHFTGALVKQWGQDLQIDWNFHVAYHPMLSG